MTPDEISGRVQDPERGDRDVMRGPTAGQDEEAEKEASNRFHAIPLSPFFVPATQFLTSATNSLMAASVVAQEHISR